MKYLIITLVIIAISTSTAYAQSLKTISDNVYTQSLKNILIKNAQGFLQKEAETNESTYSIITSFVYAINHLKENTNEKGFAIDFQIDQTNYISWLLGVNMSFYKRYETYNVSTFNSLIGTKFYFNKDKFSDYFRISVGMTYFGEHTNGGSGWNFSMFPAFGLEYLISKKFKIYFEPNLNLYLLGGRIFQGKFVFNTGIITKF